MHCHQLEKSVANNYLVTLLIAVASYSGFSDAKGSDSALHLDPSLPTNLALAFANNNNIEPDISAFKVLNVVPMSSRSGRRVAMLTIENTESGQRSLNHQQVMGLFADGMRRSPEAFKQLFTGRQRLSITVDFAQYDHPLLQVYTRNE